MYKDEVKTQLGVNIYGKVSFDDFIKMLKKKNVRVHRPRYGEYHPTEQPCHVSSNSYGEFCFLDISTTKGLVVSVWGLGYHEMREQYVTSFEINYADFKEEILAQPTINKANLIRFLEKRKADDEVYYGKPAKSNEAKLFSLLADYTDDDAALTEMEDMDLF
jgi:hypothetical protein